MSGKVVTSALVASALGVGVVVGLAAPRSQHLDDVSTVPNAQDAQLVANLVTKGEWVATIADAATVGRIDGMRVALLITDGTPAESVEQVRAALTQGGAIVAATGQLGVDWWEPSKSSFRAELATQMSPSVIGAEGLGSTQVMEHAILQAIVPGASPRGASTPTGTEATETDSLAEGVSNQEVLLEVLTRAEILSLDHPAADGVDALVIVTAEGPEGAGAAVNASASVWEQYLGATEIVFVPSAGDAEGVVSGTIHATASDAIAAGADTPKSTRPSVVILTDPTLASAQIVMALKEQSAGGSGTYGTAPGLGIIAIP